MAILKFVHVAFHMSFSPARLVRLTYPLLALMGTRRCNRNRKYIGISPEEIICKALVKIGKLSCPPSSIMNMSY